MKTYMAKLGIVERPWYVVDASGKVLGRMAAKLAERLQGKHRPTYTPHVDTGDFIIVVNAEKVVVTGRKAEQKVVQSFSGWPGGLRMHPFREFQKKHPEQVIRLAVRRMLPKNRLARKLLKKLKIYRGSEHPHAAQQPKPLDLGI